MSHIERLDEIQARADKATALTLGDDNARDCYNIVADDVPALVTALRAVLELADPDHSLAVPNHVKRTIAKRVTEALGEGS